MRCFGPRQKIDFSDGNGKPKLWTIILGDNGTGKTTILSALAAYFPNANLVHFFGLFGEQNLKISFLTRKFLSSINKQFKVSHKSGETDVGIKFSSDLVVRCFSAYGASRKTGASSISQQNEESAYITLFDENASASLLNPEEWLLQTDYASKRESEFQETRKHQLEQVQEILIQVLPDVDEIRFSEKERGGKRISQPIVEFHTPYGWVKAKDLSLGYRTSMAWVIDFASRMFDLYPESENPLAEPAVVLVDEIDLHLHPKWQRELLDYLSNLFPNTQFIVTTHSPLIVQAALARDANIAVCRRDGDHVVIDQSVEALKNWRADQILTSDFFDLPSARPKEVEKWLKEKDEILAKPKLTKKDEKRLDELEEKIGFLPVSESQADDEAMKIIHDAAQWIQSQAK